MKIFNDDLQMRSDWMLPLCTGGERLKNDDGDKLHPTQKPEALLHRVLLSSTNPGDVVLDPFFGTGTTGAVAKQLGRVFIGIERDQDYARSALERIEDPTQLSEEALRTTRPNGRNRAFRLVRFWNAGWSRPATRCMTRRRAWPHGSGPTAPIACKDTSGSIHKIGAYVQGAEACNGWTFWHVRRRANLVPLDVLRQQVRAELGTLRERPLYAGRYASRRGFHRRHL